MQLRRSLAQMVRAGLPYAMVPPLLGGRSDIHLALDELIDDEGVADGRFGNLCAAQWHEADVIWVCLQPLCPARFGTGEHGWPDEAGRAQAAGALAEQTDPLLRIERRVAFALDPSTHPLLVSGMPSA